MPRAIVIDGEFGFDNLRLIERPRPRPGPGQVLLRMRAASLNYRDLLVARGQYDPRQPLPLVPLSDGVGEVEECGPGVTRVRQGDRVCPIFAQKWLAGTPTRAELRSTLGAPLDGALADYMLVSEEGVVVPPAHLTDPEAAALPCAALTAWSALVTLGALRAGQTVLVQGSGGVAIFALQFAKLGGARVIATSSAAAKRERLLELGADAVIDYRADERWGKTARKLSGEGVDLVVELGGAGTLAQSLAAVKPGGTVALIGVLAGHRAPVDILPLVMQGVRVQGIFVGHRESFEAMNTAIAEHELRPVIDRVFPFEEAREAFEYMADGAHLGKVCLTLRH